MSIIVIVAFKICNLKVNFLKMFKVDNNYIQFSK